MNTHTDSRVLEKFLKYIKINTRSSAGSDTVPSTPGQLELAGILCNELKEAGAENVLMTEKGYVYGFLPATAGLENVPVFGFIAHMDTSDAASGENIKPDIIRYDGTPVARKSGEELFGYLRETYDFCIVDSSAELSEYYRQFAMLADEAVVVSLHQSTAIRAAEKTAANLAAFGHSRVQLVVNGYRAAHAKDGSLPTVLEMIRRSSIPLVGVIPMSEELPPRQEKGIVPLEGKDRRKLFPYEAAFLNIALRLCGGYTPLLKDVERPGRKKKRLSSAQSCLPAVSSKLTTGKDFVT